MSRVSLFTSSVAFGILLLLFALCHVAIVAGVYKRYGEPPLTPQRGIQIGRYQGYASTYCSQTLHSVRLAAKFDVDTLDCQKWCDAEPSCNFCTVGRWDKGLPPAFGGNFGVRRCQLFASCWARPWAQTSLWAKPGHAPSVSTAPTFPSPVFLAGLPINFVALFVPQVSGACALGIALVSVPCVGYLWNSLNIRLCMALAVVVLLNALTLLHMWWYLTDRVAHLRVEQGGGRPPSHSGAYRPPRVPTPVATWTDQSAVPTSTYPSIPTDTMAEDWRVGSVTGEPKLVIDLTAARGDDHGQQVYCDLTGLRTQPAQGSRN